MHAGHSELLGRELRAARAFNLVGKRLAIVAHCQVSASRRWNAFAAAVPPREINVRESHSAKINSVSAAVVRNGLLQLHELSIGELEWLGVHACVEA
jgi:hypothetical protein